MTFELHSKKHSTLSWLLIAPSPMQDHVICFDKLPMGHLEAICLCNFTIWLLQSQCSPLPSVFLNYTSYWRIRSLTSIDSGFSQQGNARLPFTCRASWLAIQSKCKDLHCTHAHLTQGTRPSKKLNNIKAAKRYLSVVTTIKDGLLVVKQDKLFVPSWELHGKSCTDL